MQSVSKKKLFKGIDLKNIKDDPDFKEDSVREVIVLPLLQELGYKQENIVRSKTLNHPFLKVGSKKKRIQLIPDYSIKFENIFAWVLDAKSPNEKVKDSDNVEQVYSYATHPEIRSIYFALCNGVEFSLYKTDMTDQPILYFFMEEIDRNWEELVRYLGANRFQVGKKFTYDTTTATAKPKEQFDYKDRPLLEEIKPQKQMAKRHFGVHGYFTKQAWNVVGEYIKNFSKPGDLVLDPFGGSGVTGIEAMMNNRKAISIDINPMAVFIVKALVAPVKQGELGEAFERVKTEFTQKMPCSERENAVALKKYPYPKGYKLPKGSDVETVDKLFSLKQLAQLALLKAIIKKEKNENIQQTLLLMFSGLLNKINLTYHASKGRSEGRGNSGIFAYYRYRIATKPASVEILPYLISRFRKVQDAKKDLGYFINERTINGAILESGV